VTHHRRGTAGIAVLHDARIRARLAGVTPTLTGAQPSVAAVLRACPI
jgi:anti-anti-sigma regulatory factor